MLFSLFYISFAHKISSVFMRTLSSLLQIKQIETRHLSARNISTASWWRSFDLPRFLVTLHSICNFFFHLNDWTTINLIAPPFGLTEVTTNSICQISIWFQIGKKITISIDLLPDKPSDSPSPFQFYSLNWLQISSKVFRNIAKQSTQEAESIRWRSSKIQMSYWKI